MCLPVPNAAAGTVLCLARTGGGAPPPALPPAPAGLPQTRLLAKMGPEDRALLNLPGSFSIKMHPMGENSVLGNIVHLLHSPVKFKAGEEYGCQTREARHCTITPPTPGCYCALHLKDVGSLSAI